MMVEGGDLVQIRCEVFPILLGAGRGARRALHRLQYRTPRGSAMLSASRPWLLHAPTPFSFYPLAKETEDTLLLSVLFDIEPLAGDVLPLLLICDPSYLPFATRHREELERRFVVRCATEMEGCYETL